MVLEHEMSTITKYFDRNIGNINILKNDRLNFLIK
jgi:hypothetical protein